MTEKVSEYQTKYSGNWILTVISKTITMHLLACLLCKFVAEILPIRQMLRLELGLFIVWILIQPT